MTILTHELSSDDTLACYDVATDTIQFSESILNTLNTDRDISLETYKTFTDAMERIDSGDLSDAVAVKLDDAIGSIGVGGIVNSIKDRIDGIC